MFSKNLQYLKFQEFIDEDCQHCQDEQIQKRLFSLCVCVYEREFFIQW